MVQLRSQLRKAVLAKADPDELENIRKEMDHTTMRTGGKRLINDGITTGKELNMVCGVFRGDSYADCNYQKVLDSENIHGKRDACLADCIMLSLSFWKCTRSSNSLDRS